MTDPAVVPDDLRPPRPPTRRHLLSVADLARDDVERLLATARNFAALARARGRRSCRRCRGRLVVNLFYESSTRTSSSFELAAKRLSADTLTSSRRGSSVDKGESLKDTALTLGAYDPDVIVIRHPQIGAPQLVARVTDAHVVNAGDGKHQHPTQALLDLYTIQEALGRLEGLHVAIVGDVLHSRVARSLVQALALVGAHVHARRPAGAPRRASLPAEVDDRHRRDRDADVVYVLRMQNERMQEGANYVPSLREYSARWGVTPERLRPGQKVMHPGPMNRGVEIDPRVADSPDALVIDRGARPASSSGWRSSTTCSPRARSRSAVRAARSRRRWRDGVLVGEVPAATDLVDPRRARARPGRGDRRRARRPRRRRHDRRGRRRSSRRTGTASSTGPGSCSRPPSSTRTSTCARPAARTRRRSRPAPRPRPPAATARSSRCRTPTRSSTRPACSARSSSTARPTRRRCRSASSPRSRAARRGEELTEMGELADAGAAAFSDDGMPVASAGADAARAPVLRDHRPAARAPLRGADALARRPRPRGRRLGRARLRRLPVGRRESVDVERDLALAAYEGQPLHLHASLRRASRSRLLRRAQRGRRRARAARRRRTTSSSPTRPSARSTRT